MTQKISIFSFSFLFFAFLSIQSFAGGDPDDFAHEDQETTQAQEETAENNSVAENHHTIEISKNVSAITGSCVSFPEAIAYKEHFACFSDIEKNRIARINWSFSKLLLR
tara:strand:+ start:106 stop:432 length:327 start_codon:yes stop_codon:yes gene_type:complete